MSPMTPTYAYFYDIHSGAFAALTSCTGPTGEPGLSATTISGERQLTTRTVSSLDGLDPVTEEDASGLHAYMLIAYPDMIVADSQDFLTRNS